MDSVHLWNWLWELIYIIGTYYIRLCCSVSVIMPTQTEIWSHRLRLSCKVLLLLLIWTRVHIHLPVWVQGLTNFSFSFDGLGFSALVGDLKWKSESDVLVHVYVDLCTSDLGYGIRKVTQMRISRILGQTSIVASWNFDVGSPRSSPPCCMPSASFHYLLLTLSVA